MLWEGLHGVVGHVLSCNGAKLQSFPTRCDEQTSDQREADGCLKCEAFGEDDKD